MRIKEFTASKKLLTNIGNYSNIEVSASMTVECEGDEKPNWDIVYDELNQQLLLENANLDQSWIKKDELLREWKLTLKIPKRVDKTKEGDK